MRLKHAPLTTALLLAALTLAACGGAPAAQQSPAAAASPAAQESPAGLPAIGGAEASPSPAAESSPSPESSPAASPAASPAGGTAAQASPATAAAPGEMLAKVQGRGELICGAHGSLPGFGNVDPQGDFVGFDVDFCKAVAAAVLGDPEAVQYRALSAQERFTAVQSGEVDLLSRNTTWTTSRDSSVGMDFAPITFYDGQGMMARGADNIATLEDLDGASICVQSGTTTELNLADAFRSRNLSFTPVVFAEADPTFAAYEEGRCDAFTTDKSGLAAYRQRAANPDEHVILDVTMSKEPLAPAVLQGDPQWRDIVTWVIYGVISAEEYGITSENVDTFLTNEDPNIRRLLGVEGDLGVGLGLDNDFMVDVIRAVGNYSEIYNRHLGPETSLNIPRGQNALYTEGGLLYAPPFR